MKIFRSKEFDSRLKCHSERLHLLEAKIEAMKKLFNFYFDLRSYIENGHCGAEYNEYVKKRRKKKEVRKKK